MRSTAECNTHNTEGREYPERRAICAQDVILRRHETRVCKNGYTLRTAPAMMLEMRLCAFLCSICSVTVYFRCQVAVSPEGCA